MGYVIATRLGDHGEWEAEHFFAYKPHSAAVGQLRASAQRRNRQLRLFTGVEWVALFPDYT